VELLALVQNDGCHLPVWLKSLPTVTRLWNDLLLCGVWRNHVTLLTHSPQWP